MKEVGGYRLEGRIGSGGMGVVYHAIDADGRDVALKLLHPHISMDPGARARLAREVDLLHRVRGRGVARVLDAEVEDDLAFVVTELIDGPTLEELIEESGTFGVGELSDLAEGLAAALRNIHRVGVVHRDLKPGNVMMSVDGPVLIDFGIAQVADDSRLTQTGMVTGTPGYLDPQLVDGADPTPAVDWWAWSAVLVYAATGRRPFGGGPAVTVLSRMSQGDVDVEGIDPLTATALRAALRPDPDDRLAPAGVMSVLSGGWDADDLADALALIDGPATQLFSTVSTPAGAPGGAGPHPPHTQLDPAVTRTVPLSPQGAPYPSQSGHTRTLPVTAPSEALRPGENGGAAGPAWGSPSRDYAPPVPTAMGGLPAGVHVPGETAAGGPFPPPGEVPSWLRPAPPRTGLVAILWLLLAVVVGLWPGWGLVGFAGLLILAGAVGLGTRQTRDVRRRRGRKSSDGLREAMLFPLNLIAAAFLAVFPLIVGAGIGWLAAKGASLALGTVDPAGMEELFLRLPLWGAALAALLTAWFVPGAGPAREGARVLLGGIFPFAGIRFAFGAVCMVLAGLAVVGAISGALPPPDWAPLPQLLWL